MRAAGEHGYAMLAAVLIAALAMLFALAVVAAVGSLQAVATCDASVWRVRVLTRHALAMVADRVRWQPSERAGVLGVDIGDGADGGHWTASWSAATATPGTEYPVVRVDARASLGEARHSRTAVIELRPEAWAGGVLSAGDVEAGAPLTIEGSGLYAGGCVSGRENVSFAAGAGMITGDGMPRDLVHGDVFPAAAVHARGAIYAGGEEIHAVGTATAWRNDTDVHSGGGCPDCYLALPDANMTAVARERGGLGADASADGVLDLAELITPAVGSEQAQAGWCMVTVVPPGGGPLRVSGALRDPRARVLLLVIGDVVVGEGGAPTSLSGALVVMGNLRIEGELAVDGSLAARTITIAAPLTVRVLPGWQQRPLAGAWRAVLMQLGE